MSIYIDIDGTLTDHPLHGGNPLEKRIDRVRQLIEGGHYIVVWSASGADYAKAFCKTHNLKPVAALSKPSLAVDDNPTIRPLGRMPVQPPEEFFGEI